MSTYLIYRIGVPHPRETEQEDLEHVMSSEKSYEIFQITETDLVPLFIVAKKREILVSRDRTKFRIVILTAR